ncbi:phosphate regulon sensor histidine kinase PhoR [Wenzhouxiangella marina]|uniref:Phosphate regulon sensor protein PhoR n=1 Tax=Wenzhouxiangella marina TaxID=1579979 RepID=A0A0K0XX21_9GAMM|nr:phosphate regulon sensor histidine kinase PhoR [Wenzhouxiangella marina]AKS42234.1 histidine kinase [Wenzhouxiangella marina]MBB6085994.1 two-component system phosphate regulon sensor histidine kinase PhoR [Wenzhouxiangella marina]
MNRAWLIELLLPGLYLIVALFLGLLVGNLGWWLVLALALTLARHLRELDRLERWLRNGRRRHPPQSWGVWGEVFEHYYRLQRRYYKRKKRLARVIHEFRESTAAMPDGSIVLDSEFRIKWFNDAARDTLRLSSQNDLGQSILNLLRSPDFMRYVRSGNYELPVYLMSPVDESRTLSARLIPYGREQYLLMIRDVTRLQRLQTMRRDFVANASHELRSPITVLSGYLESLESAGELGPDWDGPMAEMQAQCRRMTHLINDLLELSRLETEDAEASERARVEVPSLLARIVQSARIEDREAHEIDFEAEEGLDLVGEEGELHSAFSNLIINALRYTPSGGRIRVRWRSSADGGAVFEVQDEGIGIEEKHLPFITQRFYRVNSAHSRRQGGTGLGLAIVKHVLQRHRARLDVQSTVGKGSTFSCHFPAVRVRRIEVRAG